MREAGCESLILLNNLAEWFIGSHKSSQVFWLGYQTPSPFWNKGSDQCPLVWMGSLQSDLKTLTALGKETLNESWSLVSGATCTFTYNLGLWNGGKSEISREEHIILVGGSENQPKHSQIWEIPNQGETSAALTRMRVRSKGSYLDRQLGQRN